MAAINELHPDVLNAVFDHCTLTDLLRAMGVCQQWRYLAQGHSTFWQDIELREASESSLGLFSARLSHKSSVPDSLITITVVLLKGSSVHACETVVIPTIASNLPRIRMLSLALPRATYHAVYNHLSLSPAPALRRLVLQFSFAESAVPPVPVDLFRNDAPLLLEVTLFGVNLADIVQWPPCFGRVERMSLVTGFEGTNRIFLHVLQGLESLKHATIGGGPASADGLYTDSTMSVVQRLQSLIILLSPPPDFLRWPPMRNIPTITIVGATDENISNLSEHLRGLLHLEIGPFRDTTLVHFSYSQADRMKQRTRTFGAEPKCSALRHPNLVSRVVQMTLSLEEWKERGPNMLALTSCTTVILLLHDTELHPVIDMEKHVPALTSLIFERGKHLSRLVLESSRIVHFISPWTSRSDEQARTLRVAFRNIDITGDTNYLPLVR